MKPFKESVAAAACLSPRLAASFLPIQVSRAPPEHRRRRVPCGGRWEEPPCLPVAHGVISPFESTFIKVCFILDGILCLHEIVHDLRVRGSKAVILKLDFEKLTTRSVGISSDKCC